MSIVKEPAAKAPWPPKRSNDKLFRYPKPYPVGKEKGETFATVAKKHAIGGSDLVNYNFQTKDAKEINWYLANYVGSPAPKPGEQYYGFFGATYDAVKNTGVIFIPMFGEDGVNHQNRLGEKVVEEYNRSTRKTPGGRCYETCHVRVKDAGKGCGNSRPRPGQEGHIRPPLGLPYRSEEHLARAAGGISRQGRRRRRRMARHRHARRVRTASGAATSSPAP